MRPLHVLLLVADPARDDVATLRDALRSAGHVVVDEQVDNLPAGVAAAPDFIVVDAAARPSPERLDSAEARHIAATLHFTQGNKRQAALLLGIARSTLLTKIRRYHLTAGS
ncbi:MAG TPA: helix-turn-helix domain-containing protein [Gemmatimonadales bacterium]|jgi:DNA-binding NtrC family response regulator